MLPTLTTYLVFVMLLASDPSDAATRFWERVVETGLGVGLASIAGIVVLPALVRRRARGGHLTDLVTANPARDRLREVAVPVSARRDHRLPVALGGPGHQPAGSGTVGVDAPQ